MTRGRRKRMKWDKTWNKNMRVIEIRLRTIKRRKRKRCSEEFLLSFSRSDDGYKRTDKNGHLRVWDHREGCEEWGEEGVQGGGMIMRAY